MWLQLRIIKYKFLCSTLQARKRKAKWRQTTRKQKSTRAIESLNIKTRTKTKIGGKINTRKGAVERTKAEIKAKTVAVTAILAVAVIAAV